MIVSHGLWFTISVDFYHCHLYIGRLDDNYYIFLMF